MNTTLLIKPKESPLKLKLPLFTSRITAGFPSPADDFTDKRLDLNEHLIQHPSSTFYLRVVGDSMIQAGIFEGDLMIVDKSLEPQNGSIVVAILHGEFTVKRLVRRNGALYLQPENPLYNPVEIKEGMDFQVWGIVTHVIHSVGKSKPTPSKYKIDG